MSTTVQRGVRSLVNDLMAWLGSVTSREGRYGSFERVVSLPPVSAASTRIPVNHRELPVE